MSKRRSSLSRLTNSMNKLRKKTDEKRVWRKLDKVQKWKRDSHVECSGCRNRWFHSLSGSRPCRFRWVPVGSFAFQHIPCNRIPVGILTEISNKFRPDSVGIRRKQNWTDHRIRCRIPVARNTPEHNRNRPVPTGQEWSGQRDFFRKFQFRWKHTNEMSPDAVFDGDYESAIIFDKSTQTKKWKS